MSQADAGQSSSPTAFTARLQARVFARVTGSGHPVRGQFDRLISPIWVAAMLVSASPTARRAEAANPAARYRCTFAQRHRTFTVVAVRLAVVTAQFATGICHGPTI